MRVKVKAPVRISLLGGGTDVGEYAEKYGGVCVNMAVNLHQEFILTDENKDMDLLENDSPEFIKTFTESYGVYHRFDGYIHAGLGSSAAAAVALVAANSKFMGLNLDKSEIADIAWDTEVNTLGLFGGKQDQYASAYGGMNIMYFGKDVIVDVIDRKEADEVSKKILLFDTGIRRDKPNIQEGLKKLNKKQKVALDNLKHLATCYSSDNLGELLDLSWRYKKESNAVTTNRIDFIYDRAMKLGAEGGKLCGSGGGGYMIFVVPKDRQDYFKEHIGLKWVDYGGIDYNGVVAKFI